METNYEKRIGFGPRLGAKLVDLVVIVILGSFIIGPIVGAIVGAGFSEAAGGDAAAGVGGFLAGWILSIPITSVLYSLIEGFTGASPAKMMFGIKVGNENGTEANVKTYMTRWAFYNGQGLISILTLIGLSFLSIVGTLYGLAIFVGCFLVLGEKRQSFHGKWSKTAIFNKKDLAQ